ncbi:MAG: FimV/HubP family polar landmark protein, partial [Gammaproteobacteria bacterium]|nr:FimV/HubP family polar landmark protein [Gammaproteobacteria bacterium]
RAAAEPARAVAAASGAIADHGAALAAEAQPQTQPATPPEAQPEAAQPETQAAAPSEPMVEAPVQPLSEAPAEPAAETPETVSEAPAQPQPETPVEPAAEAASAVESAPESAPETAAAATQEQTAAAEEKPKKKKKKKKPPVVAPAPQPTFLESVLESLPVDPVLLGAGVGGLLVVLGGAALWRRRRAGEDAEDMGELDLGDLDESDLLYDEDGEPYLPDDVGEETAISELEGMDLSDEQAEPQVQARAGEEDPLEATHVAPPGAAGRADSDDDPLTEVNVYLAYERYDQAEELVRSAIAQYPDRHEYKLRLLEVFYAAKDLGSFESSAHELQDAVGDDSPLMAEARKMWQDMSPGRELFSEAESTVPEDQDVVFDVTGGDTETPATVPGSSLGSTGDESSSVDFDLGFDTEGTQTEAASGESSLDFDLGFDQAAAGEQARDESGLDLDLTSIGGGDAAPTGADAGAGSGVDFDLGDESSTGAASGSASMDFDLSGVDEPMGGGPSTETPLPERVSRDGDDLDFDLEGLGEGTLIDSQVPPEAPAGAFADESPATAEGDDGALDFDLEGIGGESDDAGSGGLSGDAEFTALDLDLDAADAGSGSRASGLDFDAGDDLTAVDDVSSALGFDVGGDSVDAAAGASADDGLDFGLDLDDGDFDVAGGADVTDETVKLDLDAALPGDDDAEQDTVKLTSPEFDAADSAISDLGMDLDLDMGDDGAGSSGVDTAFEGIFGDDDAKAGASGEDDMALSLDGSDLIPPTPPPEPEAPAEEFPEIDLDFDAEKSQDAAASDEYESTQFMLRDMPASDSDSAKSGGASSEGHTLMLGGGLTGEVDEVQTKLDLAQAYIDMGDTDGAKGIIDEVLAEGNSSQKNAAMGLLSKLASS